MRTLRLALLSAGACTAFGCFDQNAIETLKEKAPETLPAIREVPGATPLGLVQPYPNPQAVHRFTYGPLAANEVPQNLIDLQRHTYTEFANTMDFGAGRMIPPPGHRLPYRYAAHGATLDFTNAYPPESPWHGYWKIEKLQLIGTIHDAKGNAYDTKDGTIHRITAQSKQQPKAAKNPETGVATGIPIREQTEFEEETLAQLRTGAQLIVKHEPERLQVIGAIRAITDNCKSCHSVPEGHLMGAFTYELKRMKEKPVVKTVSEVVP